MVADSEGDVLVTRNTFAISLKMTFFATPAACYALHTLPGHVSPPVTPQGSNRIFKHGIKHECFGGMLFLSPSMRRYNYSKIGS